MSGSARAAAPRRSYSVSALIVTLFSVFMSIIVVVMSVLAYNYSYQTLRDRTVADNEVIVRQAARSISRYIENIRSVSSIIDSNREIHSYLQDPAGQNAGLARTQFSGFLNYLPQIDNNVESVFIFGADRQVVYAPSYLQLKRDYDITQDLWFQTISQDPTSEAHLIPTTVRMMTRRENPWVISVARNILNERTGEVIGYQLVELNYSMLDGILSDLSLGENGYVFIIDSSGTMIYHPQLQLLNFGLKTEDTRAALEGTGTVLADGGTKIYNVEPVTGTDYTVVGVTYTQSLVSTWLQMMLTYLVFGLLMSFAAFLGAVQLARYVTRPLGRLERAAEQIADGALDTAFDGHGTRETEHVAASLQTMLGRIRELMEQSVRDRDRIRVSEIRALQWQINPHFLYNTLDTIVWMAEETGAQEIRELTMALAVYFRVVLSRGQDMIPVREEMRHVSSYLYIQNVRYETLTYDVHAAEDAEDLYMPKLLVQPIVENAIYHGIRDSGRPGRITVTAEQAGGRLIIRVEDNGRGMRPRELSRIWDGKAGPRTSGVALRNIRERILLYFGEEYGIRVESVYKAGTVVTIELPVLHDAGGHNDE